MSKKVFSLSSAPTSIQSKCSSSSISVVSSPSFKSPSVDALHRSLSSKQHRLTESLILYSQELSAKIPKIAQKWNFQNARLRKILKKKKNLEKLSNKKFRQSEKAESQKIRVRKLEDLVMNEKIELIETKKKVESLKSRLEDFRGIQKVLNDLEFRRVRLSDRIRTFKRYEDVSREQFGLILKNTGKIKKLAEKMEVRKEEVLVSKEDVDKNCWRVQRSLEVVRNQLKDVIDQSCFRKNKARREVEVLKDRLQRISLLNYAKRQDLKNLRDKIEANLALIRLEYKHVDARRKKIKEVAEWVKNQLSHFKTL